MLGDYQKALDHYKQALPLWQTIDDRGEEADILRKLGDVYSGLDNYQQALDSYRQALPLWQAKGDRVMEVYTSRKIALSYSFLGEKQEALDYLNQAIQLSKAIDQLQERALLLSSIGLIYFSLGDDQQALDYYSQALSLYRALEDRDAEAKGLASIARVYERQGDIQGALDFYQRSIELQEKIRAGARLEELKTLLAEQSSDAYQRAILLLMRLGQLFQAFDFAERARARTFLDQVGHTRLDMRKGAAVQLVQQEQSLRQELAALERDRRQENAKPYPRRSDELIQSWTTQLTNKRTEYEELLTHIKLSSPEYASLVSVSPATLPEVQQRLEKDTTLLSYVVTKDKTLVFVVTQTSLEAVELPVNERDLIAAITEFRHFVLTDSLPESLTRLYTWLIMPLKPHLKTPIVGVIPHGILHYLPFAALTDGQKYFGDEYKLFNLPSASVLRFIQEKRKPDRGNVLALGQSQAEGFPTLRYAKQEAQAIAKIYNAHALVDNAATESIFRARAGSFDILHLAAHGQLNTVNPLFSRIILAPDSDADGSLEVHEVYGLDLANADLVVLSACQTQLGAHSRGDDIIGLNRAFIYAGTPTVIASLWSVDDQATSVLMTAFYRNLKQGKSKADAIRAAQTETRAKYPHPYYWASFVLLGDLGATPSSRSNPNR